MIEDKYVGLLLAITSSLAIGTSYVITKKGLHDASERHGYEGDGHQYFKNPIWWGGIITLVVGEIANFAAYAFAPAILVTPLGALSVIIGAALGAYFLKERMGTLGKLGCAICLIGSVIIVLHAPPDKEIKTVDELIILAIKPGIQGENHLMKLQSANLIARVSSLLYLRGRFFQCYDLQSCAQVWKVKSSVLPLNLCNDRISLCYGRQSFWHCTKVDTGWK